MRQKLENYKLYCLYIHLCRSIRSVMEFSCNSYSIFENKFAHWLPMKRFIYLIQWEVNLKQNLALTICSTKAICSSWKKWVTTTKKEVSKKKSYSRNESLPSLSCPHLEFHLQFHSCLKQTREILFWFLKKASAIYISIMDWLHLQG